MRYIGVDLHKTNFVACFLAADDTQSIETYPLTRDGLSRFKRQLRKVDEVAVEATQNVHYFYDQVKARVTRVAVVDTYRFGVVAKSKKGSGAIVMAVVLQIAETKHGQLEAGAQFSKGNTAQKVFV